MGGRLESAARIDDDARGIGADDVTNRESRVIRDRAADPDDDGIYEGAQPVQVRETGGSIDIAGTAGRGGDAPVERLANLTNDDEPIRRSAAQRPEYLLPWRRKVGQIPEHPRNRLPGFGRTVCAWLHPPAETCPGRGKIRNGRKDSAFPGHDYGRS